MRRVSAQTQTYHHCLLSPLHLATIPSCHISTAEMTVTVFMFVPRKPGTTLEAFKDSYEKHVLLVAKALRSEQPTRHTRYYLQRNPAAPGDTQVHPPLLFLGDAAAIDYDCITTVEFDDDAHFMRFNEALQNSPMKQEIEDDQNAFSDFSRFKIVAVEKPEVTAR